MNAGSNWLADEWNRPFNRKKSETPNNFKRGATFNERGVDGNRNKEAPQPFYNPGAVKQQNPISRNER